MGKKIIFSLIIALGIFLRLWQLHIVPGGLFLDEINMATDAKTLVQNGVDQYGRHFPFYFEDATDFKLPGYIYATAFFYRILGNQISTVHITASLAGIVSIFLIGFLARLLFPEKKYIFSFAAATLALSPFAIHFSRIGYETTLSFCFVLVYLIALLQVLHNRHTKFWLFVGSIAILIADWTYPSPRFVIPSFTLLFLTMCFFLKFEGIKPKQIFTSLVFLGVVAITFIPTIIFPFADARQLNLLVVDTKGATLLQSILMKASSIFASYVRLWNLEFLFDKGDVFAYRHGTKENGIFLLLFIIPFFSGIVWTIQTVTRKNFSLIFLLLFALVAGLPSALSSEFPYGTRVVPMLLPYTLFIALGMSSCLSFLKKQKNIVQKSILVLLSITLFYQIGLFSYIYFVDFRSTSLPEFPTAPVRLARFLVDFHKNNPTTAIYFLGNKSCRTWGNDALYLWYYADLPNALMIPWNNAYKTARYAYKKASPFEAYDIVQIPPTFIPSLNLYLYSGYEAQSKSQKGSLLIRCGSEITSFNKTTEQLLTVVYENSEIQGTPFYIINVKK